jgi:hypothetical protein
MAGWISCFRTGGRFRAEGRNPGPVAECDMHNADLFARLIREGDLGFCEAYHGRMVVDARSAGLHGPGAFR